MPDAMEPSRFSALPPDDILQQGPGFLPQQDIEEEIRLRKLWNDNMKNSPKAVRYLRTDVLMLSWEDTDLFTQPEVDELADVFRDTYHFHVQKASIEKGKRAQSNVHRHLSAFIDDYDKAGSLLIIYYAGHGWYPRNPRGSANDAPKGFYLSGKANQEAQQKNFERNRVAWDVAEQLLLETDADVLAIFDCCHAGHLCRFRGGPIRFEYLGACEANQQTGIPGANSFTTALIWALRELSTKERFAVCELLQKIEKAPNFPKAQHPRLAHRIFPSPDHIQLAPIQQVTNSANSSQPEQIAIRSREFLDLRFHFPTKLQDNVVAKTAQALSELIVYKKIDADCISLIGSHVSAPMPKMWNVVKQMMEQLASERKKEEYFRRWQNGVKRKKSTRNIGAKSAQYLTRIENSDVDISPTNGNQDAHEDLRHQSATKRQPENFTIASSILRTSTGSLLRNRKRERTGDSSRSRSMDARLDSGTQRDIAESGSDTPIRKRLRADTRVRSPRRSSRLRDRRDMANG